MLLDILKITNGDTVINSPYCSELSVEAPEQN